MYEKENEHLALEEENVEFCGVFFNIAHEYRLLTFRNIFELVYFSYLDYNLSL